ncbi:MAG: tRNA (adenosine(37)-N6)-threonylcarbamoyltransferase complex dimerization subunit type 1 TsaB [Rhizobiaceae bacterium]
MYLLAIDTSAHLCAAAVLDTVSGEIVSHASHDIGIGHAERLMDVIGDVLNSAKLDYSSIGRIAASTGPGSFTGVRVGLATARGIALGLGIEAVGVSSLDAARHHALGLLEAAGPKRPVSKILCALDARRDETYCQLFPLDHAGLDAREALLDQPGVLTLESLAGMIDPETTALCGSAAVRLQSLLPQETLILHDLAAAPIEAYAALGAIAIADAGRPEPLYLRSADAKPQKGFAVSRL